MITPGKNGQMQEQIDFSKTTDVFLYPNPTQNIWYINASKIITSADIYDLQGRLVIPMTPNSKTIQLRSQELSSGIYIGLINKNFIIRLIKE